jgi:hypothetical protein
LLCQSCFEIDCRAEAKLSRNRRIPMFDINVLNGVAKFFRVLGHLDFSGPMKSEAKRENLAAYLDLGCPKVDTSGMVTNPSLPEGYDLARLMLGDDFISPEEVARAHNFVYSSDQLEGFEESLPDMEKLLFLRSNGCTLIATPPTALNLLDVRTLDPSLFCSKTEGWYEKEKQKFARAEFLSLGTWLVIRKDIVPNSLSKNWSQQKQLISDVEYIPMAVEVAYAITTYYKARGVRLFEKLYVNTSSISAGDIRVHLGGFGDGGLDVNGLIYGDRGDFLGLASAWK